LEPSVEECVRLASLNEEWNLKGLVHACKGNFRSVEKVVNGRLQEKGLISGMHTEKAFEHFKKMCNFKDELFKVEKFDKSQKTYEKLATNDSNNAYYFYNLGEIHY